MRRVNVPQTKNAATAGEAELSRRRTSLSDGGRESAGRALGIGCHEDRVDHRDAGGAVRP